MDKLHAMQPLAISLTNQPLAEITTPLALTITETDDKPVFTLKALPEGSEALLNDYTVSAKNYHCVTVLPSLKNHMNQTTAVVGLNLKAHSTVAGHSENARNLMVYREALRQAAGTVTRSAGHFEEITLAFADIHGNLISSSEDIVAVAEGAALGHYSFKPYKKKTGAESNPAAELKTINILTAGRQDTALSQKIGHAAIIADAVNHARDLVNHPPNILTPERFAQHAIAASSGLPLKVTVWDEKKLAKEGCNSFLGVGQGSGNPPRLVKMEYQPHKEALHLALVGKGITFDSGGLSLKPPASMTTMKADMAGAAAIFAAIIAAAKIKSNVALTAWLCLAENMPSRHAQRPGDVYTAKNGTTVEVLNTDAEGRLVLADGLSAASEENPDIIIDVATLTGAQRIALGPTVSAVMGNEEVSDAFKKAADTAGEKFWAMPLPEELRPSLDSETADISNIGDNGGGMLTAGLFLREFVGNLPESTQKIAWAHLDIAGPSYNDSKPWGYTPRGGTGVGVRSLIRYIEALES